mmetsp:Transcript_41377/g.95207  ORF Transcript_41377/g.95207 Transcript_41377/m.95207 type:complete len:213 (+) Transcript_41377:98-736(+)
MALLPVSSSSPFSLQRCSAHMKHTATLKFSHSALGMRSTVLFTRPWKLLEILSCLAACLLEACSVMQSSKCLFTSLTSTNFELRLYPMSTFPTSCGRSTMSKSNSGGLKQSSPTAMSSPTPPCDRSSLSANPGMTLSSGFRKRSVGSMSKCAGRPCPSISSPSSASIFSAIPSSASPLSRPPVENLPSLDVPDHGCASGFSTTIVENKSAKL